MISKADFVNIIEAIKDADNFMTDIAVVCGKYGVEYEGGTTDICCKLLSSIVELLTSVFNDTDQWISWWVYDCQYGKVYSTVKTQDADGNWAEEDIDTPEKLYDFLVNRY